MTPQQSAALAKHNLYAFPKFVSNLKCPPHLKFIADKIQEKLEKKTDKFKLLLISVPPRHGKTLLISKHAVPWFVGRNPDKHVILTSYSSDLSDQNSDFAKNIFTRWGPTLWDVYPSKTLFNRDEWNTDKGGGVKSSGIGGGVTGFGADLFIIDDYFKNDKEAESETERESLWSRWQSTVGSRLHPGCLVIILATRWNSDDLIGRLVEQAKIQGDLFPFDYEYINLPAIATNDPESDPLGRKTGEALWPARYNKRLLADIERIAGPYWWASLYQGNPVKKGGNLFKTQNFRYYTREVPTGSYLCWRLNEEQPLVVRKGDMKIATIVDPAIEIKKKNDPCGMHTWGYSRTHKIWLLLDRFNDRIEHSKVNQIIKNFAFKSNANYILVENEKLGKVIVKNSAGKDKIGGKKIPFKEVPTKNQDKYLRAIPMATYGENERVFFPKNAIWLAEYEKKIKDFPTGGHDEDADLTAYAATMEDSLSIAEILATM